MNKLITFCIFLIIVINSCSKYDNLKPNIENIKGIWFEERIIEENKSIYRREYNFNNDNLIEILGINIDKESKKVLGYSFRQLGNYKLENDQLTFYNLSSYYNDYSEGPYSSIENLVQTSEIDSSTVTCKFEEHGKKLILIYPPCGPFENCIGSTTLIRN
jgi:hypothetical protein